MKLSMTTAALLVLTVPAVAAIPHGNGMHSIVARTTMGETMQRPKAILLASVKESKSAETTTQTVAAKKKPAIDLSSESAKLSYTVGVDLGTNFKKQGITVDANIVGQGIHDALTDQELKLNKKQMKQVLQMFQQKLIAKRATKFQTLAIENKMKGEAFLAKNKKATGVVSLPNGLQYRVLTAGTGVKPTAKDVVTVEYTGTLINGTVFDSTKKLGKPATFKVSEVIAGWSQALKMMRQGAVWQVFIPAKLAYGARGVGGPIGPNETLIFKIRLISVSKG